MTKTRQSGQSRRALAAAALGLAFLGGCSSSPSASTQHHDPLHGVLTPPSMPQPTHAPKTPGTTTSGPNPNNQSFAPIGSDLSSTNNATLAAGSSLGRPLAIEKSQSSPVVPAYNPNPRVEPVPDINPAPTRVTPSSWQAPASSATDVPPAKITASPASIEQLRRQLEERGVYNQNVEPDAQGVKLTCYAPNGAGRVRALTATAVDYTTAAQAILRQLER